MGHKRRVFTRDLKIQVIREIQAGKSQAAAAREHQVAADTISKWIQPHVKY